MGQKGLTRATDLVFDLPDAFDYLVDNGYDDCSSSPSFCPEEGLPKDINSELRKLNLTGEGAQNWINGSRANGSKHSFPPKHKWHSQYFRDSENVPSPCKRTKCE